MKSNGEHVDASAENKQNKKTNSTVKKSATNSFERLRGGNKLDRISGAIQIIQQFKGNHAEIQNVSNVWDLSCFHFAYGIDLKRCLFLCIGRKRTRCEEIDSWFGGVDY